MERIYWMEYQGQKILIEDFSNMKPGEAFVQLLEQAREQIHSQPEGSVLALFDATGAIFNMDVIEVVKEFVRSNTPYVKAAAVVGIQGLLKVAMQSVNMAARRSFKLVKSREEGMDWLMSQA